MNRVCRRLVKLILILLLWALLVELGGAGAQMLVMGRSPGIADLRSAMNAVASNDVSVGDFQLQWRPTPWNVGLSPFFGTGWVQDYWTLLSHGRGDYKEEDFVVAITGGSVAQLLVQSNRRELQQTIQSAPALHGRTVAVILLGMGTWKQPQQLQAISTFLAFGGRFDAIVNLDGFNEVNDTLSNHRRGIFFGYPSLWRDVTANTLSRDQMLAISRLELWKESRSLLARTFMNVRWSLFATVTWGALDRLFDRHISQLRWEVQNFEQVAQQGRATYRSGPVLRGVDENEVRRRAVSVWIESSLVLQSIAKGAGALYIHALQPNQYVPGSKVFSLEETKIALSGSGDSVVRGYPLLRAASHRLIERGIYFADLTNIFGPVAEAVYLDNCCHLNSHGNRILAEALGKVVVDVLQKKGASH